MEHFMKYEIVPWVDDPHTHIRDDYYYDPWVAASQADEVANRSNIRISRAKELSWIAINDAGDVIGAIWSSLERDQEAYMRSDEDIFVFDFDVAVDPEWRSGRIGLELIEKAIGDLRDRQDEFPGTYARVWVVNPRLVRVLERKYGFETESQYKDGSAHMLLY